MSQPIESQASPATDAQRAPATPDTFAPDPATVTVSAAEPTLTQLLLAFLEHEAVHGARPQTLTTYRGILRRLVHYLAQHGITTAAALTAQPIVEFLQAIAEPVGRPRLSRNTLGTYAQAIRRFLAYLTDRGSLLFDLIQQLPALPKTRGVLPIVPSEAEIQAILEACPIDRLLGIRTRALLELLYGSGCRIGEAMNLTLGDLDLAQDQNNAGRVTIRAGKGGKDRVVPLADTAALWLNRYLHDCRPWLARKDRPTNALFLASTTGKPLSIQVGRMLLQDCAKRAGIALPVVPHSLRHAAATHLLSAGCDIRYIQLLLGHANPDITERYTKVEISGLAAAHARFHPAGSAAIDAAIATEPETSREPDGDAEADGGSDEALELELDPDSAIDLETEDPSEP